MKKVLLCTLTLFLALSFTACYYTARIPNKSFDNIEKIEFSIDANVQVFDGNSPKMSELIEAVKKTLKSGKIDFVNGFDKVKMPCDQSTVDYNKGAFECWIELSFANDKYKKAFFTIEQSQHTQSLWLYVTKTNSYNDGEFMKYHNCDLKSLLDLLNSYNQP